MSTRLYFAEFPHRLPPRPLRFLSPAFPIPHQPVTFTLCLRLFRMLPANKQISRRNRMEYVVELAAGPQNRRNRELDTLPWDRGAVSSACSAYCPQILKIHPPRLMTTRRRISVFQPAAAKKPVAEQTQHDSMLRDDIEASARFDRRISLGSFFTNWGILVEWRDSTPGVWTQVHPPSIRGRRIRAGGQSCRILAPQICTTAAEFRNPGGGDPEALRRARLEILTFGTLEHGDHIELQAELPALLPQLIELLFDGGSLLRRFLAQFNDIEQVDGSVFPGL